MGDLAGLTLNQVLIIQVEINFPDGFQLHQELLSGTGHTFKLSHNFLWLWLGLLQFIRAKV